MSGGSTVSQFPIETRILSKIIEDQDFHSIEKAQINESFFFLPENKAVFQYIKSVFYDPLTRGLVPSAQLVSERFPSFFFPQGIKDAVPILAGELRAEKVRTEILSLAQNIVDEVNADPMKAKSLLLSKATEISSIASVGEDLTMAAAYKMLLENYETVQKSGGVIGIPYPWEPLNAVTQGMKGGEFIVLYGRPKSMKSFVALYMASDCYLRSRRRVLFFTMEMSPLLVCQRTAAMFASVEYDAFKSGKLQPSLQQHTFSILKDLMEDETLHGAHGGAQPCFSITSSRSAGGRAGVSWLRSKVTEVKPHILFVDGMYLMSDDRSKQRTIDHKSIGQISQDLKLLAQEFDIPVVAVTQANRGAQGSVGEDLTELSFSDSLGQDADAVYRISKQPRLDDNNLLHDELWITAPGLREGKFDGIVVGGYPCFDFACRRVLTNLDKENFASKSVPAQKPKTVTPSYKSTLIDPKIAVKKK